jgi:hypothetical protein
LPRGLRSRVNQPDPAFPQSPGIILKRTTLILLSAARFVLSMNCEHHIRFLKTAYNLICTTYAQEKACEKNVNKLGTPMKSRHQQICPQNYSQEKPLQKIAVNKFLRRARVARAVSGGAHETALDKSVR